MCLVSLLLGESREEEGERYVSGLVCRILEAAARARTCSFHRLCGRNRSRFILFCRNVFSSHPSRFTASCVFLAPSSLSPFCSSTSLLVGKFCSPGNMTFPEVFLGLKRPDQRAFVFSPPPPINGGLDPNLATGAVAIRRLQPSAHRRERRLVVEQSRRGRGNPTPARFLRRQQRHPRHAVGKGAPARRACATLR